MECNCKCGGKKVSSIETATEVSFMESDAIDFAIDAELLRAEANDLEDGARRLGEEIERIKNLRYAELLREEASDLEEGSRQLYTEIERIKNLR